MTNKTPKRDTLTQLLDDLEENLTQDIIEIGQVVEMFRNRGFGALLLVPSLITVLPTGAIPLIPAVCGALISFICIQMIIGREHLWLPERLKKFTFPRERLQKGISYARPVTRQIDKFLYRRFSPLIGEISQRFTALICLCLSLIMIFIGFIPMLPATVALPIFFFGLGYIARDGVIIALGYLTIIGSLTGLYFLVQTI